MKHKDLNALAATYKQLLKEGNVQLAYSALVKYVQRLKTECAKTYQDEFVVGNVLQGYMDFTYFYLSNDFLKHRKLKLAMVFNHQTTGFELWLLGQTKTVQMEYWKKLKNVAWVDADVMPEYSVFEISLVETPDFNDLDKLTVFLVGQFTRMSQEVFSVLEAHDKG